MGNRRKLSKIDEDFTRTSRENVANIIEAMRLAHNMSQKDHMKDSYHMRQPQHKIKYLGQSFILKV